MQRILKSIGLFLVFLGVSDVTGATALAPEVTGIHAVQQDGVCTGVVTDVNGESLIGATAMVKGTSNGTITDMDGHFTLNGVRQGDVIEIAFMGYTKGGYPYGWGKVD